jgi:hypothetical protein
MALESSSYEEEEEEEAPAVAATTEPSVRKFAVPSKHFVASIQVQPQSSPGTFLCRSSQLEVLILNMVLTPL